MKSNVSDLSSLQLLRDLTNVMTPYQRNRFDGVMIGVLSARVDPVLWDYCQMTSLEFFFRGDPEAYKVWLRLKYGRIAEAAKAFVLPLCAHFNIDTEHDPGPTCPVCQVTYFLEPLYDELLGKVECPRLS